MFEIFINILYYKEYKHLVVVMRLNGMKYDLSILPMYLDRFHNLRELDVCIHVSIIPRLGKAVMCQIDTDISFNDMFLVI